MKLIKNYLASGDILITVDDVDGQIVAAIPSYVKDKEKWADLFVASYDMLEALKAIEHEYYHDDGVWQSCPDCENVYGTGHKPDCIIGNAIKLAEGEERGEG